ncbi:MAG: hypothetical protein LBT11_03140, partial [Treponema sp.]|jgi:hypothetical protein|nr:hypothetical protein [Treponema sp.]
MAVKVTEFRLEKQYGATENQKGMFHASNTLHLHKYDYDTLRYKDAFQFESWIVQQFGGTPNTKQRGDMGLDGKAADGAPIQVKRSDNIGRGVIDNFKSAVERFDKTLFEKNAAAKKPIGYIIAFSFGQGAKYEAARLINEDNIIIKLVCVEDIVPLSVKPNVTVHISDLSPQELEKDEAGMRKIECTATGDSLSSIQFYSWDFAYDGEKKKFKPSVIMDKEGKQVISLKPGAHTIAVKVVDNDGLENIEVIKLKINGAIQRV